MTRTLDLAGSGTYSTYMHVRIFVMEFRLAAIDGCLAVEILGIQPLGSRATVCAGGGDEVSG